MSKLPVFLWLLLSFCPFFSFAEETPQLQNAGPTISLLVGAPSFIFYPDEIDEVLEDHWDVATNLGYATGLFLEFPAGDQLSFSLGASGVGQSEKTKRSHIVLNNILYSIGAKYFPWDEGFYGGGNLGFGRWAFRVYSGSNSRSGDLTSLVGAIAGSTKDFMVGPFGWGGDLTLGFRGWLRSPETDSPWGWDAGLRYSFTHADEVLIQSFGPFVDVNFTFRESHASPGSSVPDAQRITLVKLLEGRAYRDAGGAEKTIAAAADLTENEKLAFYQKYRLSWAVVPASFNIFYGVGSLVQGDGWGSLWCASTMVGGVILIVNSGTPASSPLAIAGGVTLATGILSGYVLPFFFEASDNARLRQALDMEETNRQ